MTILLIVSLLIIWFYGVQLALWLYALFFRKSNNLAKYAGPKGNGSWAIVTGATAGIGLAFCQVSESEMEMDNVYNTIIYAF